MVDDSPPRLGDLVKMKIDEDRGLAGVIHKVRIIQRAELLQLGAELYNRHGDGHPEVYDITWPDGIQSVQYKSEIRVISRS